MLVENGKPIRRDSGIVTPDFLETNEVTNNQSELMAALQALLAQPPGWRGKLHTDSQVTIYRLNGGGTERSMTPVLNRELTFARGHSRCEVSLVGGHPTKIDLEKGFLKRNGAICSKWNAACDARCCALAKWMMAWQSKKKRKTKQPPIWS